MKLLPSLVAALLTGLAASASAQATRTWVSGVGDDANPGSRTAPCKTFAGAISKTAVKGVINVLDPGGFGAVTITKSITIDGTGSEGHILASGTNGIVINAADDDVVILRNIQFEGAGTGLVGVKILKAGAVYLENCRIENFQQGVVETTSSTTGTQIFLRDCLIHECSGEGISLAPGADTASVALLENTRVEGCGTGISVADRGRAVLNGCTIAFNVADGLKKVGKGVLESYKNNHILGNTPDGKATTLTTK
ncbi:right-handed parallel beta-helix repeat-containing protein [Luteolibacter soli]|uniref:Right-handed parallel beta-helix repeat-containing protein n=1 Tax=Luteolibacter soli TaxID=3135280 RepID=A0ABU9AVA6_9BACT